MGQPYVGEIRLFAGNFAPQGWFACEGQLLSIAEYETLFNLIGTTYGGDGQSTYGLPDLRGRLPVHRSPSLVLGQTGGAETVTLTVPQLPSHTHRLRASTAAGSTNPPGSVLAAAASIDRYREGSAPDVAMAAASLAATGGTQPHTNVQPYLCLMFIISLFGIFPSPN